MIEIGTGVIIYGLTGAGIVQVPFTNDCKEAYQLMDRDDVTIDFTYKELIDFPIGSHLFLEGKKYILTKDYTPKKTRGTYRYTIIFDADYLIIKNIPAIYNEQSGWSLTGNLQSFAQVLIGIMNDFLGVNVWGVGIVDDVVTSFTFSQTTVFDALNGVSSASGVEWWFDGYNLNFTKQESGDVIEIQAGGIADDIDIQQSSSQEEFTRLYAYGSTRNIPLGYRSSGSAEYEKRLLMPEGVPYIDIIEGMTNEQVVPGFKIFESVYPRMVCVIDQVIKQGPFLDDNGVPYHRYIIHQSDFIWKNSYKLATPPRASFQSGLLSGRDFDLSVKPSQAQFENWKALTFEDFKQSAFVAYCHAKGFDVNDENKYYWWSADNYAINQDYDVFALEAKNAWEANMTPDEFYSNATAHDIWAALIDVPFVMWIENTEYREYLTKSRDSYLAYYSGWFEIEKEYTSIYVPNESSLYPQVGDAFIPYNYDISAVEEQLIPLAESELEQVARLYMEDSLRKRYSFSFDTNKPHCKKNNIILERGQRVKIIDSRLRGGFVLSRIFSYERTISGKHVANYTAADNTTFSTLSSIDTKIKELSLQMYAIPQSKANILIPTNENGETVGLMRQESDGGTILSIRLEDLTAQTVQDGHIAIKTNDDGELFGELHWIEE